MNIPDSVINFLFNGITNRIELVLKHTEILDIKKELLIKYGTHEFMINYDFEDDDEIE